MSARDIVYGRRGGRWADPGAGTLLAQVYAIRLEAVRAGEWPADSLKRWLAAAAAAQARCDADPDARLDVVEAHAMDVAAAHREGRGFS